MLIKIPQGWEIPESRVTPESVYWNRRAVLRGLAAAGGLVVAPGAALAAVDPDPSAHLYPVERNPAFTLDRPLTDPVLAVTYNNFYEYGSDKQIAKRAQQLRIRPWMVVIDGMVEKPLEMGIDDLLGKMPLEERLYRHRCVEAWSMAVPWSGFAMRHLVALAQPTSGAKYVSMETFLDKSMAPGQKQFWYPWAYLEGLTMAEATNDLAFLATGIYGQPLPRQNGAPLRLVAPWKYGFKSIKSVVRFRFTRKRPISFWQRLNKREYGFWANVNPKVRHPRWSQATERVLGTDEKVPTLLYNGYADHVAHMYEGLKGQKLYR